MCGKDNSSEIFSLKSRLSNTRDQILKEEKEVIIKQASFISLLLFYLIIFRRIKQTRNY